MQKLIKNLNYLWNKFKKDNVSFWNSLEEQLILSDVSSITTYEILDEVKEAVYKENIKDIEENKDILIQGSLERSNTNSIKSMISLIDAQRRFEQAQKAITSIDEINKKVIDSIGNGR